MELLQHLRRRTKVIVAATADPRTLDRLWGQGELPVREVRTTDGLNALLAEAGLVVLDDQAVRPCRVEHGYLRTALTHAGIPTTDSTGFLADPDRWFKEARAFDGDVRSLPPRLAAFTSLASGGVGKTTLTLGLAWTVARRTRLPVAILELTHATSGFLAVLDMEGFTVPPADAYVVATQGAEPGRWRGLTVVPMEGRQGALLTAADCAALLDQLRGQHTLVIVDAVQPHPLWPAVRDAADRIFVVAAADRPDTVANAQLDLGERRDPRATLVVNLANRLDHLAGRLAHLEYPLLTVPRRSAIARYSDPLPMLTASIWPGIKL